MRVYLVVATVLLWSTAQAATITFDDMPTANYDISFTTPQGYTFTKSSPFGPFDVVARSGGGNFLLADGPAGYPFVTLTQSAEQAFSLHQMDLLFIDDPFFGGTVNGTNYGTDVLIRAKDQFGNLIAEVSVDHTLGLGWRTVTFDSSWANIMTLELSGSTSLPNFIEAGGYDNIVVSTVPIPAAVWMFSSALAGLGWLRLRRRVVQNQE